MVGLHAGVEHRDCAGRAGDARGDELVGADEGDGGVEVEVVHAHRLHAAHAVGCLEHGEIGRRQLDREPWDRRERGHPARGDVGVGQIVEHLIEGDARQPVELDEDARGRAILGSRGGVRRANHEHDEERGE